MGEEEVELVAHRRQTSDGCPSCGVASERVHSYYTRKPRDLPLAGYRMRLRLRMRRFRCLNGDCRRVTFVERMPELVPPGAQRTQRLTDTLRRLALAQGGEAGARYGRRSGLPASPDTLLRILRQSPLPTPPTPRVLGVDDFALRKGRLYGTILVDGETHQPIELLADRTAQTLARWLAAHPGVEIITRDRAPEYGRGAALGAPTAVQVADRWHLLTNLREMVGDVLVRLRRELEQLPPDSPTSSSPTSPPPLSIYERDLRRGTKDQLAQQQSRARRYARYAQVRALHAQGHNILQIARTMRISRQTVRHYLASDTFPEYSRHPRQPSLLDPYVAYLQQRWDEGCHHNQRLYEEIRALGFAGSIRPLVQWTMLRRRRAGINPVGRHPAREVVLFIPPTATAAADGIGSLPTLPSTPQLAWLLVRPPTALAQAEQTLLTRLRQSPTLVVLHDLAQRFMTMVRKRASDELAPWLSCCLHSEIPELVTFANGLQREQALIQAALSLPFSNGVVEGHVTRLKQIRRAMYGRGSFDLLRRRVLIVA